MEYYSTGDFRGLREAKEAYDYTRQLYENHVAHMLQIAKVSKEAAKKWLPKNWKKQILPKDSPFLLWDKIERFYDKLRMDIDYILPPKILDCLEKLYLQLDDIGPIPTTPLESALTAEPKTKDEYKKPDGAVAPAADKVIKQLVQFYDQVNRTFSDICNIKLKIWEESLDQTEELQNMANILTKCGLNLEQYRTDPEQYKSYIMEQKPQIWNTTNAENSIGLIKLLEQMVKIPATDEDRLFKYLYPGLEVITQDQKLKKKIDEELQEKFQKYEKKAPLVIAFMENEGKTTEEKQDLLALFKNYVNNTKRFEQLRAAEKRKYTVPYMCFRLGESTNFTNLLKRMETEANGLEKSTKTSRVYNGHSIRRVNRHYNQLEQGLVAANPEISSTNDQIKVPGRRLTGRLTAYNSSCCHII